MQAEFLIETRSHFRDRSRPASSFFYTYTVNNLMQKSACTGLGSVLYS